jgi:hypothetical protein
MKMESRERELITAIEIQQECMYDLKSQLDEKNRIIHLQQQLLAIRELEIEKLEREITQLQIENNWRWN